MWPLRCVIHLTTKCMELNYPLQVFYPCCKKPEKYFSKSGAILSSPPPTATTATITYILLLLPTKNRQGSSSIRNHLDQFWAHHHLLTTNQSQTRLQQQDRAQMQENFSVWKKVGSLVRYLKRHDACYLKRHDAGDGVADWRQLMDDDRENRTSARSIDDKGHTGQLPLTCSRSTSQRALTLGFMKRHSLVSWCSPFS